jgi:tetratricopeptide (TPR) repeat protein
MPAFSAASDPSMPQRLPILLAVLLLAGTWFRLSAQAVEPPLPIAGSPSAISLAIDPVWGLQLAGEALRLGFGLDAARRAQELLSREDLPQTIRTEAERVASLALLSVANTPAADRILEAWTGPRDARFLLRRSLSAALKGGVEFALEAIDPAALPPEERPWLFFLRGVAAENAGDPATAQGLFNAARDSSVSRAQRARFEIRSIRASLLGGDISEANLARLREQVREFSGRQVGWMAALQLVSALDQRGQLTEAADVIDAQMLRLPAEDPSARDLGNLLLGLLERGATSRSRAALVRLVSEGRSPDMQRAALQILVAETGDRAILRDLVGRLTAGNHDHPLFAELLLARAFDFAEEGLISEADGDLRRLIEEAPDSPWTREALLTRAWLAWRQSRFNTVVNLLLRYRQENLSVPERERATVLLGDAFLSAGMAASAAEAYAEALAGDAAGLDRGALMFQVVTAHLRAGQLERARAVLDNAAGDAGIDTTSRWRAEWNFLKALQAVGSVEEALERLNGQLAPEVADRLPVDLRLRFFWLRGELALAAGRPSEAVVLAQGLETLVNSLPDSAISAAERARISSSARLLASEGLLTAERGREGREGLEALRREFPGSEAAQQSFLIEARQLADSGDAAGAEAVLLRLIEAYPQSRYTVQALFEAALLAERRGSDADLAQAIDRLEQLARHPEPGDLLFHARMKQGDLLRKRDRFEAALEVYQALLNDPRFSAHPGRHALEVQVADTLLAQRGGGDGNFATATGILERIFDLSDVPADLRVEAAAKLASAFLARGRTARAEETFLASWTRFGESTGDLGLSGRYWMGRMLLVWADWLERRGRVFEARSLYERLAGMDLPGRRTAQARLSRGG